MEASAKYHEIRQKAPVFCELVQEAARKAHNEAEFQRQVNNHIERFAQQLGVQLLFREQYTLATGRADAVYNRFVIEYEPPGSLRNSLNHKHTDHAVQQVKDYIVGLASAERHDRDRLLGVAFDGHYFIFVRYHDGHWVVEQPLETNAASCERFLRSLFSLSSGRALIPENLVEDFGSQNYLSRQVTRALYNALATHSSGLTARLFQQWKLFFGETAGADAAAGELKHKKELRAFARGMGLGSAEVDMPRFLFALHTYFSFLVKNIARLVLQAYASGSLGTTPLTTLASLEGEALRHELRRLESGDFFRVLGIKNLLEGDFFSWYLDAWDAQVQEALQRVLAQLAEYNPATVQDDPYSARDLLKKLYHYLLPREIRHDLGEFYTPDWLAERLLRQLNEPLFVLPKPGARIPTPDKRLLDPACGSGTFLVLAIRGLKANCAQAGFAEADTLDFILNGVVGIDLNPLAVTASRVNYLLAIADLLPYRRKEVEIPVYLADSILAPASGNLFDQGRRILETVVGPLALPNVIDTRAEMERLTDLLEEYVAGDFETQAFLARCKREIPDVAQAGGAEEVLAELYEKLRDLHRQGLNSIWARVLKNAFMPVFLEPFDYVVGNPPWINWESLPQGYRKVTDDLWQHYDLVATKDKDSEQFELGKQKRDISTLMTYVVADRYLKNGGQLAFVITQSVWKTSASAAFRRFRLDGSNLLQVLHVDDLSRLQVFEGASTRTSVFVLRKGPPTRYPVPYTYWKKTTRGQRLDYDSTLEEILAQTKRLHFFATPVDPNDSTSAWLTARRRALGALRKVLGPSEYQARAGVCTWANSVYWLDILTRRPDGLLVVRNVTEGAKREAETITTDLEPDLVYPLLRGRDVQRWQAQPSLHILLPHTLATLWQAISEKEMQQLLPKTWAYLSRFRDVLLQRSGYRLLRLGHPFYILGNVNESTFAPWKVAWTRVGNDIQAACVGSVSVFGVEKPIIPLETATMVAFDSREEAHYFCGYVNSSLFRLSVKSYSVHGTGGFASPHILTNIRVPTFDEMNHTQSQLSQLSQRAHALAPAAYAGDEAARAQLQQVEAEIDRAAARLWGLTDEELEEIQASLRELKE
jgi:hypothetical protein